jgi:hypothetical protein
MSVIVVPAIVGLGLFLLGFFQVRKLRASRNWLMAAGIVREVLIEFQAATQSGDSDDSDSYTPVVKYGFGVAGKPYIGTRIRFDAKAYQSDAAARKSVAGFRPGLPVTVFYNPANPADCVLERKNSSGWVFLILGAFIVLLALAAALK